MSAKVGLLTAPKLVNGIPVDSKLLMYPSPGSPLAIIRNEELVLLRAEAHMQTGDLPGALADINYVRRVAGERVLSCIWDRRTPRPDCRRTGAVG